MSRHISTLVGTSDKVAKLFEEENGEYLVTVFTNTQEFTEAFKTKNDAVEFAEEVVNV